MRNVCLLFIICVLLCSCKEKRVNNDRTKLFLHGNVKLLTERDYYLDTTGKDTGKKLRWTFITSFDKAGFITRKVQLDEKGDTERTYVYTYDSSHRMLSEQLSSGGTVVTNNYIHDTLHNSAISRITDSDIADDGTFYTYKYNKNRQLLELAKVPKDAYKDKPPAGGGYRITYEYNKDDKLVRANLKDGDGWAQTMVYTYDKQGNCISEIADSARPHEVLKRIRTFDDKGNKLSETTYEADGSIHSQKKEEYKAFDNAGNWLVQYEHWKDLSVIMTERVVVYYGE